MVKAFRYAAKLGDKSAKPGAYLALRGGTGWVVRLGHGPNRRQIEEEEEVEELSGSELEMVVQKCLKTLEVTSQSSAETDAFSTIMRKQAKKDWKKAESHRSLGYNGQSVRTKRHHKQLARKEKEDAKLRNSKSTSLMWSFLCPSTRPAAVLGAAGDGAAPPASVRHTTVEGDPTPGTPGEAAPRDCEIFTGYASDQSEDDADDEDEPGGNDEDKPNDNNEDEPGRNNERGPQSVRTKRVGSDTRRWRFSRNESTPVREISKPAELVPSSYLHMLVWNNHRKVEAPERAAEAQGFAAQWGGGQVRSWADLWIMDRKLPESRRGKHIKLFTLLEDPDVRAELRSYVRSNKWAIDPVKLANFSAKKMVPKITEAYGANLMKKKVPAGLKQYLELEPFPPIHMKVTWGAASALLVAGFIVKVTVEKQKTVENYVERCLVLVSHDESTTQANDGKKMSWVYEKEHALKKKGAGRGIHQSDVICSTMYTFTSLKLDHDGNRSEDFILSDLR
ncbi:hypothetical protein BDM02DRAFT_3260022 [Thelephora ganbajun]|uniref:Uncharacterized protein n=1 Tax=Thelephora ganbajun TaxID=370292 RepID=A0ACB6ZJJ2_THEGA|nr:hypothetical protein BDM02DRAFT_3260022 [Thelephora ganbajun]